MTYDKELAFAVNVVRRAGEIMRAYAADTQTKWKADNTPVTVADGAVNDMVIVAVQEAFPEDGVEGEEGSYKPQQHRKWVVDPVDGTQAYDLGVPLATCSLGLVVDGEVVLGAVYDPYMDRLYTAVKGEGAFMNGERITVSQSDTLDKSYVILSSRMVGYPVTIGMLTDRLVDAGAKCFNFRAIIQGYMCVARGAAVVSFSGLTFSWDLAAAKVILEEAGAKITDINGQSINYDQIGNGVVVTNGRVHEQVLKLLKP